MPEQHDPATLAKALARVVEHGSELLTGYAAAWDVLHPGEQPPYVVVGRETAIILHDLVNDALDYAESREKFHQELEDTAKAQEFASEANVFRQVKADIDPDTTKGGGEGADGA